MAVWQLAPPPPPGCKVAGHAQREVVISVDWEPPSIEPPPENEVMGAARHALAQASKAALSASQPTTFELSSTHALPSGVHVRRAHWMAAQLPHLRAADQASMQAAGNIATVALHEFTQPRKSVGQAQVVE